MEIIPRAETLCCSLVARGRQQFCDVAETMAVPEDVQRFGDDQSDFLYAQWAVSLQEY